MTHNEVSRIVVDAALEVHRALGPGLLESVYENALAYELELRGLRVQRQVAIPATYKALTFEIAFRADLIVGSLVVVELKSVEELAPVHSKQLLTYLKLADKKLGLLINFNVALLKDGLHRIVNNL
jgi:GxxExxY protein